MLAVTYLNNYTFPAGYNIMLYCHIQIFSNICEEWHRASTDITLCEFLGVVLRFTLPLHVQCSKPCPPFQLMKQYAEESVQFYTWLGVRWLLIGMSQCTLHYLSCMKQLSVSVTLHMFLPHCWVHLRCHSVLGCSLASSFRAWQFPN